MPYVETFSLVFYVFIIEYFSFKYKMQPSNGGIVQPIGNDLHSGAATIEEPELNSGDNPNMTTQTFE